MEKEDLLMTLNLKVHGGTRSVIYTLLFSNGLCGNEGFVRPVWKARFLVLLQRFLSVSWSSFPMCSRAVTLKKQIQKQERRREKDIDWLEKNIFSLSIIILHNSALFSDNCICNRGHCSLTTKSRKIKLQVLFLAHVQKVYVCLFFFCAQHQNVHHYS